ncbi:MAG: hypothetical protein C4297_00420 [Gemmataceae bacterium]
MSLRVLAPGAFTLLVDRGRPGWRSLGIPAGGAADLTSFRLANALVGNDPDAPALEIGLAGPVLEASADHTCVLLGDPFDIRHNDQPISCGETIRLRRGHRLHIGIPAHGVRAYLAVRGGFRAPRYLGSVCTGVPVKTDAQLVCSPGLLARRWIVEPLPLPVGQSGPLRVLRDGSTTDAEWNMFLASTFRISATSDRRGLRLEGPTFTPPDEELLSEPVTVGTVQVTRAGQLIILGVDGPTIGGYRRLGYIIHADLDRLAHLGPGETVTFAEVSLDVAHSLWRRQVEALNEWLVRLRWSPCLER